jgi:hypothetical protein
MTDKYEPRVGDLLVYGTNVYRLVAVKDKKYADVRREYVIEKGKIVQKDDGDILFDIRVSCFERQIHLKARVV